MAFYSDKHGVFRVNSAGAVQGDGMTQFGRSLHALNIDILCANTPQAKGRASVCRKWPMSAGRLAHHCASLQLGGLAEFERDLIRARTGEGRARAVERGQKMGRPFKLTDHQKGEAIKRRDQGETLADIARSYNVSPATISRLAA